MELRAVLSTNISMCGRGKLFLGLARFKSLKFTQTLILSFFFGTTTMLDNYYGRLTTSKKTSIPLLFKFCFYFD